MSSSAVDQQAASVLDIKNMLLHSMLLGDKCSTAYVTRFAEQVAELVAQKLWEKIETHGIVPRVVLTPEEAARSCGFTEGAFNQASWRKDIPVAKYGNQNRYRIADLQTDAANRVIKPLR